MPRICIFSDVGLLGEIFIQFLKFSMSYASKQKGYVVNILQKNLRNIVLSVVNHGFTMQEIRPTQ